MYRVNAKGGSVRVEKILSREEVCEIVKAHLTKTGQIPEDAGVEINEVGNGTRNEWVSPKSRSLFPTVRMSWDEPVGK